MMESKEAEQLRLKEYEERLKMWQERKDEFLNKQYEDYNALKERYRNDSAERQVNNSLAEGEAYDIRLADANNNLRDKQELQTQLTDEIRDIEQQELERKQAVEDAKVELDEITKAKNIWDQQGYGASFFGDVPKVTQNDVDARKNAVRLEMQSLNLLVIERLRKEEQLKLAISNAEKMTKDIANFPPRPDELDIDVLMARWEAQNPPAYEEFGEDEPEIGGYSMNEENDEMNFLNVIAGVELNEMEDTYELDSDADDEEKELKKNKDIINKRLGEEKQKWAESYEWMYAQRQMFQDKYYAPLDFDELLTRFRIRLRDWTGASIITINT
jgi:hypothetical protein